MKKLSLFLVLAVALAFAGLAYAETIEGTVASIDLAGKMIKVSKTDAATGATEELSISVSDTTAYAGEVTALDELLEGDEVKLDAEKDAATGSWVAKSVEVPVAPEAAEEAPEAPEAQ
jgi:hypothetical protein